MNISSGIPKWFFIEQLLDIHSCDIFYIISKIDFTISAYDEVPYGNDLTEPREDAEPPLSFEIIWWKASLVNAIFLVMIKKKSKWLEINKKHLYKKTARGTSEPCSQCCWSILRIYVKKQTESVMFLIELRTAYYY